MLKIALSVLAVAVLLALSVPDLAERLSVRGKAASEAETDTITSARVMLTADRRGHFLTDLTFNGQPVKALVDTGASIVALTYEDGRKLGLVAPGDRFDVEIQTANGTTSAKRVVLNSVRLGGITASNVEGVVVQEGRLSANLLGMSFLKRLRSFEIRDGRLILEQ